MAQKLEWLPHLEEALAALDGVPLLGQIPPFPWERVATSLQTIFGWSQCSYKTHEIRWLAAEEAFVGLGDAPDLMAFSLAPLQGVGYLVLPASESDKILRWMVKNPAVVSLPGELKEEAFTYFLLEAAHAVASSGFLDDLSPQWLETPPLLEEACYAIDLSLTVNHESVVGRVLLTASLQKSWQAHFTRAGSFIPSPEQLRSLDLTLQLVIGQTTLSLKEWEGVQPGDCVCLDSCSYDPEKKKGSAYLMLHQKPLFRAHLRKQEVKILESPFYFEESPYMDSDHEDEDEDEQLEESEDEEHLEEDDDEERLEEDEINEEDLAEEDEVEQEDHEEPAQEAQLDKLRDLPVTLHVEISRLRMTAEQLLTLRPGNLLELDTQADSGVHLVVNGRRMGKGELIKIGDLLGVRITELP